jgi:hypothetical protein
MHVLVSILILCASASLLVILLVILIPFTISLSFRRAGEINFFNADISWLNPWVLQAKFDLKSRTFSMMLLRRFRFFSKEFDTNGAEVQEKHHARDVKEDTLRGDSKKTYVDKHVFRPESDTYEKKINVQEEKSEKAFDESAKRQTDEQKKPPLKKKNWRETLEKLKSNKVLFFVRQGRWRNKIIAWALKSLGRFSHLFRMGGIKLHVRASLSDPATTGKVYGYWIGALHALELAKHKRIALSFDPVFEGDCCDIDAQLALETSLARLLTPVILAVVSFPYLSTLLVWRSSKRLKPSEL